MRDHSRRTTIAVLSVGGLVVASLLTVGAFIALRQPRALPRVAPVVAALPPAPSAPARLEPSRLLAEARRRASAWHQDAVLLGLSFDRLDAQGVAADGSVRITYGKPSANKITGGADATSERLALTSHGGLLASSEERGGKARVVPEPNCLFEDAWSAAQRAGADVHAQLRMSYAWSERHARPIWEVTNGSGEVLKRLDGVTCSILTR